MIYIIKIKDFEIVKIGYTNSKDNRRFTTIQACIPFELQPLLLIEGDKSNEKELLKEFKHLNIRGEWFKYEKEIKDYIDSNVYSSIHSSKLHKRGSPLYSFE